MCFDISNSLCIPVSYHRLTAVMMNVHNANCTWENEKKYRLGRHLIRLTQQSE